MDSYSNSIVTLHAQVYVKVLSRQNGDLSLDFTSRTTS